ncbi:hypothetical protein LSAT2_010051 [Lamellibrachia satsuma]|nr:hypothetical protein LSAT2_010051 [Lamellibrachia satsuma]
MGCTTWRPEVHYLVNYRQQRESRVSPIAPTSGRLPGTFFPMMIGANNCMPPPPSPPLGGHFFEGTMDSISFARYYLSTAEVEELYANRGACIGE